MSSSMGRKALAAGVPRFQSALKKLSQQGVEALKPQLVVRGEGADQQVWRGPAISNRIASVLRKTAIKEGTFGTFNSEALRGWDPQWDVDLAIVKARGHGRTRVRVPKKAGRQRNRELRARKIEKNMEGMEERIEEFHAQKQASKPAQTFENYYKKLMRARK
jgi:hypothetical protein